MATKPRCATGYECRRGHPLSLLRLPLSPLWIGCSWGSSDVFDLSMLDTADGYSAHLSQPRAAVLGRCASPSQTHFGCCLTLRADLWPCWWSRGLSCSYTRCFQRCEGTRRSLSWEGIGRGWSSGWSQECCWFEGGGTRSPDCHSLAVGLFVGVA